MFSQRQSDYYHTNTACGSVLPSSPRPLYRPSASTRCYPSNDKTIRSAMSSYKGENDSRYCPSFHNEEASYRLEQIDKSQNQDDNTSTTFDMDASWSDPAIRWSQNRHDGISPATPPCRKGSVHIRRSSPPRLPRLPKQQQEDSNSKWSNGSSVSSLPPRCLSDPLPETRRNSVSSAPERPTRVPSTHSPRRTRSQPDNRSYRPPAMPLRAPTMHGDDDAVSACPSFFDLSRVPEDTPFVSATGSMPAPTGRCNDRCCTQPTSFLRRSTGSAPNPSAITGPTSATLVEIAPGVSIPLRSSQETLEAIRNDYFVPTTCAACSMDLFCIEDAKFSVCPSCRTVSPLEAALADTDGQHHGVGMGFTASTLWQAQSDIMAASRHQRRYSR